MLSEPLIEDTIHSATVAMDDGDLARAEFLLRSLEARGVAAPALDTALGKLYLLKDSADAAWEHFERALKADPSDTLALAALGKLEQYRRTITIDDQSHRIELVHAADFLQLYPGRGGRTVLHAAENGDPLMLYDVSDALLLGSDALIFDAESGVVFRESFSGMAADSVTFRHIVWVPPISSSRLKTISGPAAHLCGTRSGNFFHWINELLPRAIFLHQLGFDGVYLTPHADHSFIRESLNAVGIPADRIIAYPAGDMGLRCEQCYFTDNLTLEQLDSNPKIVELARRVLLDFFPEIPDLFQGNGIYLQRRATRAVRDEKGLISLLSRYGISPLRAEDFTLAAQIGAMRRARVIVGAHGSGLTHALFMPPDSLVIELLPFADQNPCFTHIMRLLGHRHYTVPSHAQQDLLLREVVDPVLPYLDYILERELGGPPQAAR